MLKNHQFKVSPAMEYGLYILLLLGCIFLLFNHFFRRPAVDPTIVIQTEPAPELPDIPLNADK